MPADHVVGNRQEAAVWTSGAPDLGLLAHAWRPLVATGGLIARLAGSSALEATRIDIVAPTEERTKQGDLGLRRGVVMDEIDIGIHLFSSSAAPVKEVLQRESAADGLEQ
jgi:hypothetical protein